MLAQAWSMKTREPKRKGMGFGANAPIFSPPSSVDGGDYDEDED